MFDHVVFGVTDYEESKRFFISALEPIGLTIVAEDQLGIEMSADGKSSLCIRKNGEQSGHLHLAFRANSRQQVDAFYEAALKTGAKDNGAPGLRPNYSGRYYAAFVIGPDEHNIEMVCHE